MSKEKCKNPDCVDGTVTHSVLGIKAKRTYPCPKCPPKQQDGQNRTCDECVLEETCHRQHDSREACADFELRYGQDGQAAENPVSYQQAAEFLDSLKDEIGLAPKMFRQLQKRDEIINAQAEQLALAWKGAAYVHEQLDKQLAAANKEIGRLCSQRGACSRSCYHHQTHPCEDCGRINGYLPSVWKALTANKEIERLREYARHKPGCNAEHSDKHECTCGFEQEQKGGGK